MTELRHLENRVLRIPKSKKKNRKKKSTALLSVNPHSVNSPAISPVKRTPQPELVDAEDFVLLDRSSLLPASETSIPQEHGLDDETQPLQVTFSNKVKTLDPNFCSRCELRFDNHRLLLEHYRTSSMHRFCLDCFQLFPSKELLDQVSHDRKSLVVIVNAINARHSAYESLSSFTRQSTAYSQI